jgi:hypothetical protein
MLVAGANEVASAANGSDDLTLPVNDDGMDDVPT